MFTFSRFFFIFNLNVGLVRDSGKKIVVYGDVAEFLDL
jgi:hypothetical protein